MSDLDKTMGKKILLPNMKVTDVDSLARPIIIADTAGKIGEVLIMRGEEVIAQFSYNLRLVKVNVLGYTLRIIEGGNASAAGNDNPALILPPGALG